MVEAHTLHSIGVVLHVYIHIHGHTRTLYYTPTTTHHQIPLHHHTVVGALSTWWYLTIFTLPKIEYNALHPYTSWIPITLFIILRNFTPTLRSHALTLYGWLGCITLETYIGQFHTWLKTEVPDGQPKLLLSLVPASFGVNFAVCTACTWLGEGEMRVRGECLEGNVWGNVS